MKGSPSLEQGEKLKLYLILTMLLIVSGGSVGLPACRSRLCLAGSVSRDPGAGRAAAAFGLPVLLHEAAEEVLLLAGQPPDIAPRTYFVLNEFAGPVFDHLCKAKQK